MSFQWFTCRRFHCPFSELFIGLSSSTNQLPLRNSIKPEYPLDWPDLNLQRSDRLKGEIISGISFDDTISSFFFFFDYFMFYVAVKHKVTNSVVLKKKRRRRRRRRKKLTCVCDIHFIVLSFVDREKKITYLKEQTACKHKTYEN